MLKPETNDHLLLIGLRNGQDSAFKALYEKYAPRLQSFSMRFQITREDADEVVQETFIRIWQHRAQVRDDAPFSTYMMTIAKRLIYNQMKHMAHREKYVKEVLGSVSAKGMIFQEAELEKIIRDAIQQLPDRCRDVFQMSRVEGYSNQQIAHELSLSKSTVENHINKALRIIRKTLESHGYPVSLSLLFFYFPL